MAAIILASNVLCAAGRGAEQLWASTRAGIARVASTRVMDRNFDPIRMGLVPREALAPELPPELAAYPMPSRARRMLRLAAPTLKAVLEHAGEPPLRLYLGLPQLSVAQAPWLKAFALHLCKMAGAPLDAPNSRVVPTGRAAALNALELALDALERDPAHRIIVGGVDTYYDMDLLAALDAEGRILGPRVMDGFIPGEGAAFIVLAHPSAAAPGGAAAAITVQAAASVADPGHRTGSEPARGEGLAAALELLRSRVAGSAPVGSVFAALNGENFDAKLWGVARARHADFFAPEAVFEHPASCCGDTGAAAGGILVALAATALAAQQRAGPALVWAAADGESRSCALMSATTA